MSGYFGMLRTDGAAVPEDLQQTITRSLAFRGPDGSCTQAKGALGFSFSLLELGTSRQARRQPVWLGERFCLIGEVRLDARKQLISELQQKGQPAGVASADEELALFAWAVWGEACLPKLFGDFSFGLWDTEKKSFCCARDFAGAKPLFYTCTPGAFCFSNTL